MVIDKIGNINNIIETKKTRNNAPSRSVEKNDSVQISSEGKQAAEISRHAQTINKAPDVRAERVQRIREEIAQGTYDFNDEAVLDKVADRIASFLVRR